jgi:hypothetical protein
MRTDGEFEVHAVSGAVGVIVEVEKSDIVYLVFSGYIVSRETARILL